ncbi:MAG TPA: ABC transporter transmembrane domain-containing protein, partial [Pseudolysinimonas sp.]|nr:ABC transporter transmembrane domain-containing protein [Pseudolysinimonas sp.]
MSDSQNEKKAAAPERPAIQAPRRGPGGGGGPFGGMGMPAEKSMNFGPSARRLLGRLKPERTGMIGVILLGITSVVLAVLGPKILGQATNIIFEGYISSTIPAGVTQDQVVAQLQAKGDSQQADFIAGLNLHPGQGIDFDALALVLGIVLLLYVFSSVFSWLQSYVLNGITQRTVLRLRREVEAKLHRLPLSYFDKMQRGELLSRVTNDIDNISQSLQQTLSQLLISLLTVVGVLIIMFVISPILALVALVAIPLTLGIVMLIAKRSQKLFVAQWTHTGALNGQIEEGYTGHALVKVFGRHREVEAKFGEKNDELFKASFGAQFISGMIMPATMFVGNLVYVLIAVVGGIMVTSGGLSLGDVQAFIQYSRQFTQPLTQVASMLNLLQSGLASAERVFELLDTAEEVPDPVDAVKPTATVGEVAFEDVSFSYQPDQPLIEHLDLTAEPGSTVAIVGPTGAG